MLARSLLDAGIVVMLLSYMSGRGEVRHDWAMCMCLCMCLCTRNQCSTINLSIVVVGSRLVRDMDEICNDQDEIWIVAATMM